MCFSIFCQVNSHHHGDEWRGDKRDPNNNPGMTPGGGMDVPQLPEVPEQAAIGNLHLSFEFHQQNLKVRVWQISDLLLPPPQTSMIDSIFVRSYLIPDPARKTNRKTENILVEGSTKDRRVKGQAPVGGVQHIFTPSSFRFDTPLVYTGVTPDIVKGRSIRLEVCMTQKRSGKAFLMAMVHMPLRTAVKKPIRERYPLIPCMNYTIPNTMRVYNAKDIIIESSYSHSSLNRSNSSVSQAEKSAFESRDKISMDDVDVDRLIQNFTATSDSSSDEDDDGIGSSFEVKIPSGKSLQSSTVTMERSSIHSSVDDLREILSHHTPVTKADTTIDIDAALQKSAKKKIIPNELLEVLSDNNVEVSDNENSVPDRSVSTTVVVEEEPKSIVVDIPDVEPSQVSSTSDNVVIDMDAESCSDTQVTNRQVDGNPVGKKKIIPIELNFDDPKPLDHDDETVVNIETSIPECMVRSIPSSMVDSGCVFDDVGSVCNDTDGDNVISTDNISPTVKISSPLNSGKKSIPKKRLIKPVDKEDDEISSELNQVSRLSVADGLSEAEPSPTTVSRPETPIWDDYVEEEAEETAAPDTQDSVKMVGVSAPKVEAGTLADTIARLGRTMTTLDTDVVPEPVLPAVMLEEFDMDDES